MQPIICVVSAPFLTRIFNQGSLQKRKLSFGMWKLPRASSNQTGESNKYINNNCNNNNNNNNSNNNNDNNKYNILKKTNFWNSMDCTQVLLGVHSYKPLLPSANSGWVKKKLSKAGTISKAQFTN